MTIPKRWTVSEDEDHAKGTMTILGKRYKVYAGNLPGLVDAACWFVKLNGRTIANGICDDVFVGMANCEHFARNWARREWRVYG
ncbi:hypothetical protein [Sinorhizobium medicae]|jgi:hypothetical protein|uniref:hypothetical protein n=1 Tax=Sinorhizobium medicae TaxID=110321 RepID=UPI0012971034|nr:hypothetical protein [Sinorhizobium medicae]MQX78119.1 hypothetical protein [Sinorhizobium medicae]